MRLFAPLLLTIASLTSLTLASDELKIEVTKEVECNRKTKDGDTIEVHYRGTLASDGSEFDASYNRGTPFSFKLGAGMVIKGHVVLFTRQKTAIIQILTKHVHIDGIRAYWTCASEKRGR
jgi:FKBP-type peptidyl-prolyl cis-trans isomerase